MAESQKEASYGQPKKKNSLLDLDFGNDDFLSSWKTLSITGDETDLDFGSISKGKKNAFNFDKMDMDFNLDGDLGKIPSFNLDIPGIDISSPVKKDGKPKEKSKESTAGNTRAKGNGFDFTFDFNDLDGFNCKASSKKVGVITKGDETEEDSSNQFLSQKPKDCLGEEVDAHQHESRNLRVTGSAISLDVDMPGDAGSIPELSNADSPYRPLENDEVHLDSEASTNDGASDKAMTDKTGPGNIQELDDQLDKSMSPESLPQEICVAKETGADKSVHAVLRNEQSQDTVPEVLEEVDKWDTEACTLEQSAETLIGVSGSNSEIPVWSGSSFHTTVISEEKESGPQGHTSNDASVTIKEGQAPVQSGMKDGKFRSDNGSPNLVPQKQENVMNPDLLELESTLNRTATNNLMPNREREAVMRSKFFKQPDKTESRLQNALNRTGSATNDKVISTVQKSSPDGSINKRNSVEVTRDNKVDSVSSLNSGSEVLKEHSQTQNWRSDSEIKKSVSEVTGDNKVESVSSLNSGSVVLKEHSQSQNWGSGRDIKKSSSHVQTSGLSGLTINSSSKNSANPSNLTMTVETPENRKASAGVGDKVSSVKSIKHMRNLSNLKTLRTTAGVNIGSLKSQPSKDTMLSRDVQQDRIVPGSKPSRTLEVVEPVKQIPPAPSLKRKMNEARRIDLVIKPLKCSKGSPITRVSADNSGKIVDSEARDKENMPDNMVKHDFENQNNCNLASPNRVFMNDLEVPSSLDYDSNIEMAEACSKGLEDICNLLSKKHEEAKELLVRAVVNNNRLLMLNHPLYEEKIRMVQKFAEQLSLREICTQTYSEEASVLHT